MVAASPGGVNRTASSRLSGDAHWVAGWVAAQYSHAATTLASAGRSPIVALPGSASASTLPSAFVSAASDAPVIAKSRLPVHVWRSAIGSSARAAPAARSHASAAASPSFRVDPDVIHVLRGEDTTATS